MIQNSSYFTIQFLYFVQIFFFFLAKLRLFSFFFLDMSWNIYSKFIASLCTMKTSTLRSTMRKCYLRIYLPRFKLTRPNRIRYSRVKMDECKAGIAGSAQMRTDDENRLDRKAFGDWQRLLVLIKLVVVRWMRFRADNYSLILGHPLETSAWICFPFYRTHLVIRDKK